MTTTAVPWLTPGAYDGMDDAQYHADPVAGGSLSVTSAKRLLDPSCPAKFAYEREHRVVKTEYTFGHAAHKLVLGAGAEIVVIQRTDRKTGEVDDAPDLRTDSAQRHMVEIMAEGKVPMLAKELETARAMEAAVRAHPIAGPLFEPGRFVAERSMFWVDPDTGVVRRGRTDAQTVLRDGRLAIVDYKTDTDASPAAISRSMSNYSYHMQADGYLTGALALGLAEDAVAFLIVQEKTAPYLVSVIQIAEEALAEGHRANTRALRIYAECSAAGVWPGYGGTVSDPHPIHLVGLPAWHKSEEDR